MRANEFISEMKKGKLTKRQQHPTKGLHLFTDSNFDRIYVLNRVMMAAAMSDGNGVPDVPAESWSAKFNTSHPYTELEQNMMMDAYKAAGVIFKDLNKGDLKSAELDSTNKQSPVKPFKGYKKK